MEFLNSLKDESPPQGISPELEALWLEGSGNWESAHEAVKENESPNIIWIHAYLHRKQRDINNAKFHYSLAKKSYPDISSEEEFIQIAEFLLQEKGYCISDDF